MGARLLAIVLLVGTAVSAGRAQTAVTAPRWFREGIEVLTRDGGLWIADNSAYRSAEESFDAYGIEWREGIGGSSLVGRLFGIRAGREAGTFWEFRQYWDPLAGEVRVQQFGGGGAYGEGSLEKIGEDRTILDQVFVWPDGSRSREGHLQRQVGADEQVSESFDIVGGAWSAKRTYTWRRRAHPGAG